jgi:hypothetical protein
MLIDISIEYHLLSSSVSIPFPVMSLVSLTQPSSKRLSCTALLIPYTGSAPTSSTAFVLAAVVVVTSTLESIVWSIVLSTLEHIGAAEIASSTTSTAATSGVIGTSTTALLVSGCKRISVCAQVRTVKCLRWMISVASRDCHVRCQTIASCTWAHWNWRRERYVPSPRIVVEIRHSCCVEIVYYTLCLLAVV